MALAPALPHPTFFPMFNNGTFSVPNYGSNPFLEGFELTITPTTSPTWLSGGTQFTLNPGAARDFTSDFVISYNPYSISGLPAKISVDLNNTGPGGCYPIAFQYVNIVAVSEALAVYVIGDSTGVNVTSAIVATGNNFLPPGYNKWRRVGTVLISNTTKQLIQVTQTGSGREREYVSLQRLTGAGYGPTLFFTIPLSNGAFPWSSPMVTHVLHRMDFSSSDPADYGVVTAYNYATVTANLPFTIQSPVGSGVLTQEAWVPVGKDNLNHNIQYVTVVGTSPTLVLQQCGWRESMGLQLV
jgi:hypothetical protein